MTVELRVLGEVQVLLDGRALDTGHARQRCVLAALAYDANRSVPIDRLIDRVWADRPPHRPRNVLSAYVSRLRHALAGATGAGIDRSAAGYRLVLDPAAVDLYRFRDLVTRARDTRDPAAAAGLYARALALWQGDPFADLDNPWIDRTRATLDSERHAAQLERADAALRAGQHIALLGELTGAAGAHPLDERLAGQLMLALARAGQQAEALDTYRRTRRRLLDDLGAEPSSELQRVHRQVLDGRATVAPDPPKDVRPGTLPRRGTSFVGRLGDLDRVAAALRDAPLVTLAGVGGAGKTRLALEAADREQVRFADGAWLVELAPVADEAAVGHAVAAALQVQQRQGTTIEQTIVEYLGDRRLLLIVDNCEHVTAAIAPLLDQVVRRCPAVTVLATSRSPLGVDGEQVVAVGPLPDADAAALFAARARVARPDFRADGDGTAVATICRRLDGLPLGIELAAARLRAMSVDELAERLAQDRPLGRTAPGSPERHRSLEAVVDWSYRLLAEPERTLFRRLSVFAGTFDLRAAHRVAGRGGTPVDTHDLLGGLVDQSMVVAEVDGPRSRYRLLELMHRVGRLRLADAGELDDTRRRLCDHLMELVADAGVGLLGPDEARWVERLADAYDDLRQAVAWAVAAGDADLAIRLCADLPDFAYWRVGYELADWCEAALRLPGATAHRLAPILLGGAARGAWCRGDYPHATALATAAPEDPVAGAARCARAGDVLAVVAGYRGEIPRAIDHFAHQAALARAASDPLRLNWTLMSLVVSRVAAGDARSAVPEAEECLAVAHRCGNPSALCMGMFAVGVTLRRTEPERALSMLDEAAEIAASVRNRWFYGFAKMEAAAIRGARDEPAAAAAAVDEVLEVWDRLGDRSQQWVGLRYAVRLLDRVGSTDTAVTVHHAVVAAGRRPVLDPARLTALAAAIGPAAFDAAAARGARLDDTGAVAVVRAALLRVRGAVDTPVGAPTRAP